MSILRRVGCFGMMAAACILLLCASAQAQVLDQVPENAQVVVKFKNLQAINTKVIALLQRFGLAQMQVVEPGLGDPLAWLMEQTGIKEGLDKSGEMAFVAFNAEDLLMAGERVKEREKQKKVEDPLMDRAGVNRPGEPPPPEPLVLILLPITDYHALLGNFTGNRKDGDLDVIDVKNGQETFVADWGKYAVLSPNKEAIKKGSSLKLSSALRKEMDAKDLSIFVNVKAVGAMVLPKIQQHKPEILARIAAEMQDVPNGKAEMVPVVQAVVTQALAGAEHFLNECSGAVLSVNLSDDGTNFAVMADFAPGSYLGKLVQGMHNVEGSLTAGLPDGKYILYGGGAVNAAQVVQVIDDIAGPIMAELAKASPDKAKIVNDYLQGLRGATGNTQMKAWGLLAPSGPLGQSSLLQILAVLTGDAGKITDGQKAMLASAGDFVKTFMETAGAPFKFSFTVTPDAKTISGVSFSQVQAKLEGGENNPAAAGMTPAFAMIFGASGGSSQSFGKVDDKHMLYGLGVDDATLAAAVAAIKDNADPLGKRAELQLVNKNLPQKRAAALYFSVDVLANTVMDYMGKSGMPLPPIQIKPNLPPIGFTFGSEDSAYRVDCFVPTELLENLEAGMMQMMMGPGTQPNGPGGGAIGM